MSAYADDKPFSIDLVGAVSSRVILIPLRSCPLTCEQVIRQSSFINKMTDLGWTRAGFFDNPEDEVVLQHALARYHAYV